MYMYSYYVVFLLFSLPLNKQKRYQLLDSAAQRQKAYLSHGKGLQSRRLPSHLASKVGDDYYEKRKSYDPKLLLDSTHHPTGERDRSKTAIGDVLPSPNKITLTEEDREKEVRPTLKDSDLHVHMHSTCILLTLLEWHLR